MAGKLSSTLLHELAEALTAIDNYAAAARSLAGGERAQKEAELAATLEHLTGQVRRGLGAVRQLRALLHPKDAGEHEG
jgi:phosphoglycerate-specific signal transduction histidine kinase